MRPNGRDGSKGFCTVSYSVTYDVTAPFSASLTFTVGTTANTNGSYPITAVSGTWAGYSVSYLYPASANYNDNDAYSSSDFSSGIADGLDSHGVMFAAGPSAIQIYASGGTLYYLQASNGATGPLSFSFSSNVPCFLCGTRIATDGGERPVEALAEGDLVRTLSGAPRPIRWIGRRRYLRDPLARMIWQSVAPVRIRRDALADGVPGRDLLLSPDHSLYLRGHLINAKNVVNGISIVQDMEIGDLDYVHLELDRHEVILAEGAAAETYLDNGNRAQFANAGSYEGPVRAGEAPPCAWYAPNAWADSPVLAAVRAELAARAVARFAAAA